jgi:transcriptional regulator with XRE-family HTH domain
MTARAEIDDEIASVGVRLAAMRAQRGWTLEELADRTELSKPFLSRLEAGDRQPSIAAVLTLAKAYEVPVGALFEQTPAAAVACVVIRGSEAVRRRSNGLTYAVLSSNLRFSNLQPIRLTVSPDRQGDEQYQHDGEEWVYVLSGRLRVMLAGQPYDLEAGDAAHFDSRQPHRLSALDGKEAEAIVVACPLPEPGDDGPRNRSNKRAIR